MLRPRFLLATSLLLAACSSDPDDGRNEARYPQCVETRTPLGPDDMTPLGSTVRETFAHADGEHLAKLRWKNGAETELRLFVSPSESIQAELVERKEDRNGSNLDIAIICEDTVEANVSATFATEDGAFDESFGDLRLTAVRVMDGLSLRGAQALDLEELHGSYVPTELSPSEYDRIVQASIEFSLEEDRFEGSFRYIAEKTSGDSVSAGLVTAATWE